MKTRTLLAAMALGSLATLAASAQVTVIGGGISEDCYLAAKTGQPSTLEAIKICTRALDVEAMNLSNRAATYTNRGVLKMRSGDYDAALYDYSVAKRLKETVGATWLNEGAAYIFKKDYDSALASLNKAIELDTTDMFAAYYNRAIAREHTGDVRGAYEDFQTSLELNPNYELTQKQLSRFEVVETN